jgi:hypothetical protein
MIVIFEVAGVVLKLWVWIEQSMSKEFLAILEA